MDYTGVEPCRNEKAGEKSKFVGQVDYWSKKDVLDLLYTIELNGSIEEFVKLGVVSMTECEVDELTVNASVNLVSVLSTLYLRGVQL